MSASQLIANRFRINDSEKDLLGRGGMGDVYRAADTQTGETVAVKALNPEILARDPTLLERFRREGEALRQLNHPNIVHMLAAVEENGRHYLVMEYVGGGSLQDLLSDNEQLPHERVIQIALDLADALTRAHRLGIIHRDLKPANVLLAEDGTPRLADFGIAHITSDVSLTQSGVVLGSIDYLSPEACKGETLDERADIWSFGVLLFQMLSRRKPFEGDSMIAKLNAILTQKVPDLGQLAPAAPDALVDLVYRMLEKDRLQRIPSVRLVGAELEALWKGREPVTPSHPHPISVESRFATPTPEAEAPRHNLPIQTTPFVGREAELRELSRLVADPSVRLLTILGVGGMGKTRLAIEAGRGEIGNFEKGVYFVPLAGLDSGEAIIPAAAQALDFSFSKGGEPRQQLLDYLRAKHLLLILDNFEHLLEGVSLVSEILQTAARVKVVVTSRVKLNVQEEHLFHLEGMDFPDWETPADAMEYSAVKLFLQSARRVRPGFELVPDDLKYVARICRLVGGMPLGILMAAAWVEMLRLAEIAKEIGQNIDFLETSLSDVPERQRSMRGVFDHAWRLLTDGEQKVFQGLSVFRDGFTREAAQEVTGATLRELMGLVDKSLLHRDPAGRYGIHELLRQYAEGKLSEGKEAIVVHQRHLQFFLHFAETLEPDMHGPNQGAVLDLLELEHHNMLAALQWSVGKGENAEYGLQLAGAIADFWDLRGHYQEGRKWVEAALANCSRAPTIARARGLLAAGYMAYSNFDDNQATERAEECLTLCRELGEMKYAADALSFLGLMSCEQGDFGQAARLTEESLSLRQKLGDMRGIAVAIDNMAMIAEFQSDYERAAPLYQESLDLFKQIGDKSMIGDALRGLGNVALERGDYARAREFHQEHLALSREIGSINSIAVSLTMLGNVELYQGNYEKAQALFEQSLALQHETGIKLAESVTLCYLGLAVHYQGNHYRARTFLRESLNLWVMWNYKRYIIRCLEWLASIACALGESDKAVRLCSAAEVSRNTIGFPISSLERPGRDRTLSTARTQLGEAVFESNWAEGQSMTIEQAVKLAMSDWAEESG